MHAVVTGAAGFIGHHLSLSLLKQGYQVTGIDNLTDYYDVQLKRHNLAKLRHEKFKFIEADIATADLAPHLTGVEYVFHQAGQPVVRGSWGNAFQQYAQNNVIATQKLLEACARLPKLQRVVYASSSSVYGDASTFPTSEKELPSPLSPYGVTKLAGEHLATLYARSYNLPVVSLRYFTVYGPSQRPDMAFTRFIRAALRNESLSVYGDGEQVRDFTYVDDIVNANMLAALNASRNGSVFNISGGSNVSVNQVLAMLRERHHLQLDVSYLPAVRGDARRTGGDARLAGQIIGWAPQTTLEEGIERQVHWAKHLFG